MHERLIITPLLEIPRFIAGADVAFSRDGMRVVAVAIIYDRETQKTVEIASATRPADVPYVPGYLSFREGPALLAAIGKLKHPFGLIICDGQGIAHPRRCGLACHISITLDVPGIGVAKSRLTGTYAEPAKWRCSSTAQLDGKERIGTVLRTRAGVRPLFISVGHRADLPTARTAVLACLTRFRLPEPTRCADIEVARLKMQS